jgi:hypothetical protein
MWLGEAPMAGNRSARAHMARPPKGLAYMDLNGEQTKLLDDQVRLVVEHQIQTIDPRKPLADQFRELARNCYLQGVLDGHQVRATAGVTATPALDVWREVCEAAPATIMEGRKYLMLNEEACVRLGTALEHSSGVTPSDDQSSS